MVDVVMATCNGAEYISEQLDSILNQSYDDLRIIVRDDNSIDGTIEIIKKYEQRFPNRVLHFTDDVKCGSARKNFFQAMTYASSDYVMFADQDDYWLPDKVQLSLERMLAIESEIGRDKPIVVFGSYEPVNEKLERIGGPNASRKTSQISKYKLEFPSLLVQNYANGCLMMINRALIDMMGKFDSKILMHDWWAALIAASCGRIEHINTTMLLYRQHEHNVVGSVDVKSFKYRVRKIIDPETKNAKYKYRRQAQLLHERCSPYMTDRHKKELEQFIELFEKCKLNRIIRLIRGGYLKSDFVRILGQLWYI